MKTQRESYTESKIREALSFYVVKFFAVAKVKLLCSEVCATHK